ncbi:unnamed protein product [Strongylus vulgaris]|uniref:Glycoside hydrolase 35 catalytic domain-containing protein n=1 Tax=Strongylus vulgaris TaxID=40348 RepID=A0A3P7J555_STRVU|nr:unnamed protein product [Strongylus vulgaris]
MLSCNLFGIPYSFSRLCRIRALGFNAIQYYIPWNFHELYEGKIHCLRKNPATAAHSHIWLEANLLTLVDS